ncbi:MAG: hypothetical protein RI920_390 [Pseudomonadota bacterium]|jgi:DNA-binding CsgD family transcriptional regulator
MQLTTEEAVGFSRFAEAAIECKSANGFVGLINEHVSRFIPHRFMLAIIGQLSFEHLTVHHHVGVNYPDWALAHFTRPSSMRERPLLQRWLHSRSPVIVCTDKDHHLMSEREISESRQIGMGRIALHGLPDLTSRMGSYFSFAQVCAEIDSMTLSYRLALITPLLHVALLQAFRYGAKRPFQTAPKLTRIEEELLMWIVAGRTNQEMANLRSRSPATIRNQLFKMYEKLGVATRAEAVAVAMSAALNIPSPD